MIFVLDKECLVTEKVKSQSNFFNLFSPLIIELGSKKGAVGNKQQTYS